MKIEIEIPDFEEIYCSYDGYDELTGKDLKKIITDIAIEKFIDKMYDDYMNDRIYDTVRNDAKEVVKTYSVKVEGEVSRIDADEMQKGVELLDGTKFKECVVNILEVKDRKTKLEVKITEGKNREIRKIFDKFGYNVIFLKRVAIGTIKLGGLTRGTCRLLKPAEVMFLKSL
jgi:pseudouridine synthase